MIQGGRIMREHMPFRGPAAPRKKSKRSDRLSVEVRGVPQRLRESRELLNLGVVEMDECARVAGGTTSRIEGGKRLVDLETLFRYARALGVNIHWLVTGEGQRTAQFRKALALVGAKK